MLVADALRLGGAILTQYPNLVSQECIKCSGWNHINQRPTNSAGGATGRPVVTRSYDQFECAPFVGTMRQGRHSALRSHADGSLFAHSWRTFESTETAAYVVLLPCNDTVC